MRAHSTSRAASSPWTPPIGTDRSSVRRMSSPLASPRPVTYREDQLAVRFAARVAEPKVIESLSRTGPVVPARHGCSGLSAHQGNPVQLVEVGEVTARKAPSAQEVGPCEVLSEDQVRIGGLVDDAADAECDLDPLPRPVRIARTDAHRDVDDVDLPRVDQPLLHPVGELDVIEIVEPGRERLVQYHADPRPESAGPVPRRPGSRAAVRLVAAPEGSADQVRRTVLGPQQRRVMGDAPDSGRPSDPGLRPGQELENVVLDLVDDGRHRRDASGPLEHIDLLPQTRELGHGELPVPPHDAEDACRRLRRLHRDVDDLVRRRQEGDAQCADRRRDRERRHARDDIERDAPVHQVAPDKAEDVGCGHDIPPDRRHTVSGRSMKSTMSLAVMPISSSTRRPS